VDKRRRILLVEDEREYAELVAMRLEANDYAVEWVMTGEEGVQKAKEINPNLVLLDCRLPGIDGMETLRQLKADDGTKDIPVVMMTARGEARAIYEARDLGSKGYLVKPCQANDLLREVQANIRR